MARAVLLGSVVVGLTALLASFVRGGGFIATDLANFRLAQTNGLTFDYLTSTYFDHFVPGHRFGTWALQTLAPLDFQAAMAFLVVVFGLTLVLMHRLLAELFRPGPGPLLLTFYFGASAIQTATASWWTAGLSRLCSDVFVLLTMILFLRYHRTGQRGLLAMSLATFTAALLFSEDGAMLLAYLLGLHAFVLYQHLPVGQALKATLARWRVWALYLIPILVSFIALSLQNDAATRFDSVGALVAYLGAAWFYAFVPIAFGQFVSSGAISGTDVTIIVATQLALIAVVAWTVRRRPNAWKPWMFFGLAFLAAQVPVGMVRGGAFAADVMAHQYRYYSGSLIVLTIVLGAAFLPLRGEVAAASGVGPARRAEDQRAVLRPKAGVVISLAMLYLAGSLASSSHVMFEFPGRLSEPYLQRLEAAVAATAAEHPRFAVVDGQVPEYVTHSIFAPFNRLSEVIRLFRPSTRFTLHSDDLYGVDDEGRLVPVRFTVLSGGPPAALVETGRLGVLPDGFTTEADGTICVRSRADGGAMSLVLPAPSGPGDLYLSLRYRTSFMGFAYVVIDRGEGSGDYSPDPGLPLLPDRREAVTHLGGESMTGVGVVFAANSNVCVTDFSVGRIEPRP